MPLQNPYVSNDLNWLLNIPGISMANQTYYPSVSYETPLDTIAPDPFPLPTHSIPPTPSSPVSPDHRFRMTRYQLDVDYGQQASPHNEPCQTEAMKQ